MFIAFLWDSKESIFLHLLVREFYLISRTRCFAISLNLEFWEDIILINISRRILKLIHTHSLFTTWQCSRVKLHQQWKMDVRRSKFLILKKLKRLFKLFEESKTLIFFIFVSTKIWNCLHQLVLQVHFMCSHSISLKVKDIQGCPG